MIGALDIDLQIKGDSMGPKSVHKVDPFNLDLDGLGPKLFVPFRPVCFNGAPVGVLQVPVEGDALTGSFWRDCPLDYPQSPACNRLLESGPAMGAEVGIGFEGDNLEPFFE